MMYLGVYGLGVLAIIGFIGYIALVTYIREKYFNDRVTDVVDLIVTPFLIPLCIVVLVVVPLLVGSSIVNWWMGV